MEFYRQSKSQLYSESRLLKALFEFEIVGFRETATHIGFDCLKGSLVVYIKD